MSRLFEVGRSSIDSGITLIEASAGTGKTYAIAGMVVRLIAEKGLSLSQILVVTFTEAATRELRDRVRSRIRDAIVFLEEGNTSGDPALENLDQAEPEDIAAAIRHLKNALLSFDEAAIFTIHGFCQRMLRENAFETGALFDVELLTDAEPIWRETAEDFWRREFYTAEPEIASLVVALQARKELSPEVLTSLLRKISRHPDLNILSEDDPYSMEECRAKLIAVLAAIRREWQISGDVVAELLKQTNALSLNKKIGYPPAVIDHILDDLRELDTKRTLSPGTLEALQKLSARALKAKTLKKKTTPDHPFFDLCEELEDLLTAFVRLIRMRFLDTVHVGLDEAKKRRNVVTFDDLLTRLYVALRDPGGGELAVSIGSRFAAALIDEFQDTDPVQWEIFYRIFGTGSHILFLIGDPKQAIYGFRGADIFTYMEAREKADAHYTLGTNWRSDERLVEGANQLFSRHDNVFVFSQIAFLPVAPAEKEEEAEIDLGESGLNSKPLQVACVSAEDGGLLAVDAAKERILEMMLAEMNRLLTRGVKREGQDLRPGDIAVLVKTHKEADSVREMLVKTGIPAVVRTDRSVLQTEEAEHVFRLLAAILEPHKNGLVKGALASPLFGFNAEKIQGVHEHEGNWEDLTARFYDWRELWNRVGFMRMFRKFLGAEKLRTRLLALPDGERMVTNYQHIAECLHAVEYERLLTPSTLLRWLREQNERTERDSDSHIIRLEKDEEAVQIVTIHASKGLEYPVVFCPFNWTNVDGLKKGRDLIFHDGENGNRLTWDLRSEPDPKSKTAFEREQLAEAIRLLYVAVTRARNRCYLFWAVTKSSGNAADCALAHAFGCGQPNGPDAPLVALTALADGGCAELHEMAETDPSEVKFECGKIEGSDLTAREFRRELPQAPLITSFSGLTARAHDEAPDHDALPEAPVEVVDPSPATSVPTGPSIFTFPKGAKAGNFFHTVLETVDFSNPQGVAKAVAKQLDLYRFDKSFGSIISAKLRELMQIPLADGLKLGDVGWTDRLVETPFYFPIQAVTPAKLATLFRQEDLPPEFARGLSHLRFYPVDGYTTGFIDLVVRRKDRFYVIDWKSNWLGPVVADYRAEALPRAMAESFYYLQYHLYTLALHRHLRQTLPDYDYERNFGGVFYVFLRGVDVSEPSSGSFTIGPLANWWREWRLY